MINVSSNPYRYAMCGFAFLVILSLMVPVISQVDSYTKTDTSTLKMSSSSSVVVGIITPAKIKVASPFLLPLLFIEFPILLVYILFHTYVLMNSSIPLLLKQLFLSPIKFTSIFVSSTSK